MPWQRVATREELAAATPWLARRAGVEDVALALVDGRPFAVEDRCSHAGCPFSEDAELIDGLVSCNCHGSEFQPLSGAVVRGPAERPIRTFPVRVVGDHVEVEA